MARTAHFLAGLAVLQVVFAVVIPAVTSINLDKASAECYLNLLPGRVCDFAYVTSGFSLFFTLLLTAGTIGTLRQGPGHFMAPIFASLSLFAAFWWMVAAITFTKRGQQAADDGLPEGSARTAVVALSWLEFALFILSAAAVLYDRVLYRQYRYRKDNTKSVLDLEQQREFKQSYVATQALGSTPVV